MLGQLGLCHDAQGDGQRAGACFQQAATIAQLLVDYPSEARWAGNLGNTFHRLRQYPQAIGCYGRTLDIARYLGDRALIRTALANLANSYEAIEYWASAEACRAEERALAVG